LITQIKCSINVAFQHLPESLIPRCTFGIATQHWATRRWRNWHRQPTHNALQHISSWM